MSDYCAICGTATQTDGHCPHRYLAMDNSVEAEIARLTADLAAARASQTDTLRVCREVMEERDAARAVVDGIAQTHALVTADRDAALTLLRQIRDQVRLVEHRELAEQIDALLARGDGA